MVLKIAVNFVVLINFINVRCEPYDGWTRNLNFENMTDIYHRGLKITGPSWFCEENVCIRKCCPFGSAYNNGICENNTQIFSPDLYDEYSRRQSNKASDLFYVINDQPICNKSDKRFLASNYAKGARGTYHMRKDGKLYFEKPDHIPPSMLMSPNKYCIDNFVTEVDNSTKTTRVDALVCSTADVDDNNYILSSTCMLISCVFILATVGVYMWLPQLHNIHGRVLIAYLLCLFVAFIFLAAMQIQVYNKNIANVTCVTMSIIIYYSLLSAFFWLNVMCFDIWRVFHGKRELRLEKLFINSKLRAYACYAFGVPTLLTILLASLEFSGLPPNPWLPLLRYHGCFLTGKSRYVYLYGPMMILCVANIFFFIMTTIKIAATKKETSVLRAGDNSRHDQHNKDKQRFLLYVKMFIVMGVNWILEIMSALYPSEYWRYTDAYNVLIGLIIFIIFVCKKKIIKLLKERYKTLGRDPVSQTQTSWSRTTSTKDEVSLNTH